MKNIAITALASASLLAGATAARAQQSAASANAQQSSTDTSAVAEIVVTAQRRQERVATVPISITVANQAQLERQQVNTVNDLSRISPSLEISGAPGQNTGGGGAIRGIGTQTFSAGAVASVGIVVDQVSQGNANIGDLFDVSRIEVLKGPQGTLFGLTTSAGVINITTNAPDPTRFSARVHSELSDAGTAGSKYGDQIVQGVVNMPLSEDAAIRVSGLLNRRQGVDRNATTGDLNDNNRYGFRARLLWRPSSDLTVNLIGDYTHQYFNNGGDFFTFVKTGGPGPFLGGAGVDPVGLTARLASCGVTPGVGNRDYCTSQTFADRSKNYGASVQVDYDAGPFDLTSITAYRRNVDQGFGAATNVFRADPFELQVQNLAVDRRLRLFTQELRLTSPSNQTFEYTIGAFYSNQRERRAPEGLTVRLQPVPGFIIPIQTSLGANDTITDQSLAIFGQGTLHVTPKLRLIAGGRFTGEDLTLDRYNLDIGTTNNYQHEGLSTERISYRFGAQYDLMRNTMAYATASRGYKGGQIATPSLPLAPYVVRPEVPMDYEVGVKSTLFGGWVLDINAYYTKVQGYQAQQCTVVATTGVINCLTSNIDGVKTRGGEVNLFGRVFQGLSVNTGFIYTKATYPTSFIGTDGTNIGGSQLAYAPKYKFTFSGEYEHPITDRFKGFIAADAVWKSRVRYEANQIRDTTYLPHWVMGGRLGARTADDRFALAVFARNLFNVHEPLLMQSSLPYNGADNVGAIYGPSSFRQVGLSVDAKF
ncbi:TonB-dependent receptor [Sphingomonas nostoxanthinifaciens]|uniref:TonB-dependent receptor n=1 Tax=Sphingomonas nostoxanthinifaciens TaxID=2872652 RepID=UPI001CC1D4B7|nr:TonB-dependent receptor [Sphingomonas nostoxanthinifaciens]UAK22869.1 TonB-dependent receptor [Sphingomonas nostoxanthinifaciens]